MPRRHLPGALAAVANAARVVAPALGGVAVGVLIVLQLQELRQRRKGKRSRRRPVGATRRFQATYLSSEAVLGVLRNVLVNVVPFVLLERQALALCTRLLVPRLLFGSFIAA